MRSGTVEQAFYSDVFIRFQLVFYKAAYFKASWLQQSPGVALKDAPP